VVGFTVTTVSDWLQEAWRGPVQIAERRGPARIAAQRGSQHGTAPIAARCGSVPIAARIAANYLLGSGSAVQSGAIPAGPIQPRRAEHGAFDRRQPLGTSRVGVAIAAYQHKDPWQGETTTGG
jgi:hypothetical protein